MQLDRRRTETLILASISVMAVSSLRWRGESGYVLAFEYVTVATCLGLALLASMRGSERTRLTSMCLLVITPVFFAVLARMLGTESAYEMTMLSTLGAGALAMSICGQRAQSMSLVASGFLALFATVISDGAYAVWVAIMWMTICLWHLVANHWERIDRCAVENVTRSGSLRPLTVIAASLLLVGGALLASGRFSDSARFSWGFMPTSGGSKWSDPGARSGVGTGDAAVATKDKAESFGAVESEVFLESTELSLFDMVNDAIGEPKKTKNSDKRQALAQKDLIKTHEQAAKSEKGSGSEFSVNRESPNKHLHLDDAVENAVVQWCGPTGIRLAMNRYDHFDGRKWTDSGQHDSEPMLRQRCGDQTWILEPKLGPKLFSDVSQIDPTLLKVIRLDSTRVPAPMMTAGIHVKDVDRADFFAVDPDGSLFMPGRKKVPPFTVLHFASLSIGEDELIQRLNQQQGDGPQETSVIAEISTMADAWTKGCSTKYQRLTAVIDHLRSGFRFDRDAAFESDDHLAEFLDKKTGGDHLFATTAVLMARELGFESRLVSGFYVRPASYDIGAGHSNVLPQDIHTWAEIQVDKDRWIEIEPTPGYRKPDYKPSLWLSTKRFAEQYWPIAMCVCGLTTIVYISRLIWMEGLLTFCWWISSVLKPSRRLALAVGIIETRARLLGHARPSAMPPRDWLLSEVVTPNSANAQCRESVESFCDLADRFIFGGARLLGQQEIQSINGFVGACSMSALKQFFREKQS